MADLSFDDLPDADPAAAAQPQGGGGLSFDDLPDRGFSLLEDVTIPFNRFNETLIKGVGSGLQNFVLSPLKGIAGAQANRPSYEPGMSPLDLAMQGDPRAFDVFQQGPQAAPRPITEDPLWRGAAAVEGFTKPMLTPPPGWQGSLTSDVGAGFGSVGAGVLTSLATGPGAMLMFLTGGMGEAAERAQREGATPEQIQQATRLGSIAGATDLVDALVPMLGSVGRSYALVQRVGIRALVGAFAEGGQEGLQQFIQNAITRGVYKPDQDLGEGVPRSVLVGAIVGGMVGGGSGLSGGDARSREAAARGGPQATPDTPSAPDAAPAPAQAQPQAPGVPFDDLPNAAPGEAETLPMWGRGGFQPDTGPVPVGPQPSGPMANAFNPAGQGYAIPPAPGTSPIEQLFGTPQPQQPQASPGTSPEPSQPQPPPTFPTAKFIGANADGWNVFERPNGKRVAVQPNGQAVVEAEILSGGEYLPSKSDNTTWNVVGPSQPQRLGGGPPTVESNGVPVTFPDQAHADLYDIGRKLSGREQVSPEELRRVLDRFQGWAITDPEMGEKLETIKDAATAAKTYFEQIGGQAEQYKGLVGATSRPEAMIAHDVIEPDLVSQWYREKRGASSSSPQAAAQTFQTARGSTYQLHPDGTTTRNKAARADAGHEGDSGPKDRSARTMYATPDAARALATPEGNWRIVQHQDGSFSLATPATKGKGWGIAQSARNIRLSRTPEVGLIPVELWQKETLSGQPAYRKVHFGNEIVSIQSQASPQPSRTAAAARRDDTISGPLAPHRVATANGRTIDVQPEVVEAADLLTSSDYGYNTDLQPRQRDRAAAEAQVREMAGNLQPERLGQSSEADRGAPITGPDRMVESGNGRVLAIRRAYEQNGPSAKRYRDWLQSQGVDVSKYRQPVLVRRRTTQMDTEQRRAFTVEANRAATLAMSASERALADARLITADTLSMIRNTEDLGAAANRDFVRAFIAKLPQTEQGSLINAEGGLSSEGLTRIRNAILAKAYGGAPVLARITEATSDEIKSVSNALLAVAPMWSRLRADIDAGTVRPDMDITPALMEAVERAADLRAKGVKLADFFAQMDAFDTVSRPVELFLRMFYGPGGKQAASTARMIDALRFYVEEARKVSTDAGLDLGMPPVESAQLQQQALAKGTGTYGSGQQDSFFTRPEGLGAGGPTGRLQVPGPGVNAGRGEDPAISAPVGGTEAVGDSEAAGSDRGVLDPSPAEPIEAEPAEPTEPPEPPGPPEPPDDGTGGGMPRSEAEKAVLSRIVPSESKKRWPSWSKIYTAVKDDLYPIAVAVKHLADGAKLPAHLDPYKLARLTRGSYGKADMFLQYGTFNYHSLKTTGKGLKEILEPVQNDLDGFRAYAVSLRALELHARGITTGVPTAAARAVVKEGRAHYHKTFTELNAYQTALVDYLRDSGIVGAEQYKQMMEANKDYVPFFRLMQEGSDIFVGGRVRNPVKRVKGSTREIIDPIESIIKNTYLFLTLAERNRAISALVDLAHDSPHGEAMMSRVKEPVRPFLVSDRELEDFLKDHKIEPTGETFTVFRPIGFRPAPDEIVRFKNGKREVYKVDPDLANAVAAMDRGAAHIFTRIAAIPARTLRAGATLAPDFMARNILRDTLSAFVFSKSNFFPIYDTLRGLGSVISKDESYQAWLKSGAANSALVSIDRDYIQQNIMNLAQDNTILNKLGNVIRHPSQLLTPLRVLSEASEQATRLGEFKRSRKKSDSAADIMHAGFESREVTLDFARIGAQMRGANMIIAFFNAQMEGTDREVRAFKDKPLATTAKVLMAITLPSILLWFANHDDPRYKELPQWQKDLFWIVLTKDGIYRIPKPFGLGVIFGSLPERLLERYFDNNPRAYRGFMESMTKALLPSIIPTFALPVAEQFANWSMFLDRPIVPRSLERNLPEYQYSEYTTESAKLIGKALARIPGFSGTSASSPMHVENYVRGWTGTLGTYALQLADKGINAAGYGKTAPQPSPTNADIPLLKAFSIRYPGANAASITAFYERYTEAQRVGATVESLKRQGNVSEAKELLEARGGPTVKQVADAIAKQRKFIVSIYQHPTMPPADKRKLIDQTYLQMIETAKVGNKAFDVIDAKRSAAGR